MTRQHNKWDTKSFIRRSKDIHGENTFTYEKTIYVNCKTMVIITCPVMGDFSILPLNHIAGKKTGYPDKMRSSKISIEEKGEIFKKRAAAKHNNLYDYSKVIYEHARKNVTIINPIYGEFQMWPSNHSQRTNRKNMK